MLSVANLREVRGIPRHLQIGDSSSGSRNDDIMGMRRLREIQWYSLEAAIINIDGDMTLLGKKVNLSP